MRVTILGAGLVGQAIAYMLSFSPIFEDIVVVDIDEANLKRAKKLCKKAIKIVRSDVRKDLSVVEGSDIVSCALPGSISFEICRRILEYGISIVDSSFYPQDPFELNESARDNNATYIPDAGFAPGLSNIFVGHMVKDIGRAHSVEIYVGGLPLRPEGPFLHLVNWSLSDFIEEYARPARIIRNSKQVCVDPLEYVQQIEIEGEKFDAFYTDGLRTLLRTIEAENMFEKTLRYPGHLDRMKFLREIGLLSDETICIGETKIRSRDILAQILRKYVYRPDMKDRVILYMRVRDRRNRRIEEVLLEDHFDEELGLSAMAKNTGFTNAILVEALAEIIKDRGVYPPEFIGMRLFDYFMDKFAGAEKLKMKKKEEIEMTLSFRRVNE